MQEVVLPLRVLHLLGADTVGMSTAVEVIAARHMGMRVCVINCVSNMAAGMEDADLSHASVEETMEGSSPDLQTLIDGLLDSLPE